MARRLRLAGRRSCARQRCTMAASAVRRLVPPSGGPPSCEHTHFYVVSRLSSAPRQLAREPLATGAMATADRRRALQGDLAALPVLAMPPARLQRRALRWPCGPRIPPSTPATPRLFPPPGPT